MEVADANRVDCDSDQLFVAAAIRCELGPRPFFSRTACHAWMAVRSGISDRCPQRCLFSYASLSCLVDAALESGVLAAWLRVVRSLGRSITLLAFQRRVTA